MLRVLNECSYWFLLIKIMTDKKKEEKDERFIVKEVKWL
jgi:hypothetical protein